MPTPLHSIVVRGMWHTWSLRGHWYTQLFDETTKQTHLRLTHTHTHLCVDVEYGMQREMPMFFSPNCLHVACFPRQSASEARLEQLSLLLYLRALSEDLTNFGWSILSILFYAILFYFNIFLSILCSQIYFDLDCRATCLMHMRNGLRAHFHMSICRHWAGQWDLPRSGAALIGVFSLPKCAIDSDTLSLCQCFQGAANNQTHSFFLGQGARLFKEHPKHIFKREMVIITIYFYISELRCVCVRAPLGRQWRVCFIRVENKLDIWMIAYDCE